MTPAVRFDRVSKRFRKGQLHDSLRDLLGQALHRVGGRSRGSREDRVFWALRDVSFQADPGEALGIIGPNGAGKSTALKLLAGILRSDGGRVRVHGRIAALIEVSAGMHGDLTGRENIYLNGAIMGMSRHEVRAKLDDIISFAGLESFIDTPVKRYSTGMQARLGFATAAHISPDVLLVDEVLAVGDAAFRRRCERRMMELVQAGTALIFVTHNLEQMRKVCHSALVLDQGSCTFRGAPAAAVEAYLAATANCEGAIGYADTPPTEQGGAEVKHLRFATGVPEAVCAHPHRPVEIRVGFRTRRSVRRLDLLVNLRRVGGELFISLSAERSGVVYEAPAGDHEVCLTLPSLPVASGTYYAQVRLWDVGRCELLAETPYRYILQVEDGGCTTGMLALPHAFSELRSASDASSDRAPAACG